jgi:hypothetical protein
MAALILSFVGGAAAAPVIVAWMGVAVAPAGSPVTEMSTAPVKPFFGSTVTSMSTS